jgi:Asp-tRNA(Asn)/Glu-tRNA(Gln) amidotransferase A subunit family amidase
MMHASWTLTELHEAFAAGTLDAVRVCQAALDATAIQNPRLNAILTLDAEHALDRA